jgi:hypothetical protein
VNAVVYADLAVGGGGGAVPQIRQLSFWLYRFGVTIWLRDMQRQLQALNSKVPLSCPYKQNHKPLISIKVLATSLWADPAAEITVLTTKIQVSWELELPGRGGWEGWGGGGGEGGGGGGECMHKACPTNRIPAGSAVAPLLAARPHGHTPASGAPPNAPPSNPKPQTPNP